MEKIIRIMTNNRRMEQQTNLLEEMQELTDFGALALACLVVLTTMAIV